MSIEEICKKYRIKNYTINDDGSIDVDGYVNINGFDLDELPLTFNKVTGNFDCSRNSLTSLEGSPKWVGGIFNCRNNKLTSLEGSPKSVGGGFDCDGNKLTDLKGAPRKIGGHFNCSNNYLTTLEGSPKSIGGNFYCRNNPIESMFNDADIDFIRAFNTFKAIKDGVVNLKRLKYITEMFDLPIDIEKIEEYYTIK